MTFEQQLDVEPTAEILDKIAEVLCEAYGNVAKYAAQLRETKDLELATQAMHDVVQLQSKMRLDLLVARPLRQYQLAARGMEKRLEGAQ
ncbi:MULTISPECIES: hypothetical protein [Achromobacter]|uniref:hypothetical protein n=1 Tax=Achromobacter TaxID=222 RepID=UPI0023F95DAB|nr:hypothetical protein [Achromobacter anxifer]MDF8362040.1 hypothetical protein [Achromobacter anxifer]